MATGSLLADIFGSSWCMQILFEACHGATRFDQFKHRLGIVPSTLTRKLNFLVADGIMARRPYAGGARRHEYLLTEEGEQLRGALLSLGAWCRDHHAGRARL